MYIGLIVKAFRLLELASTFNLPLKFMYKRKENARILGRPEKNEAANLFLCCFAFSCMFLLCPQIFAVLHFNQDKVKENRRVLEYQET